MSFSSKLLEHYVAPTTKSFIVSNQLPVMISGEDRSLLGIQSYSIDDDNDYNDF